MWTRKVDNKTVTRTLDTTQADALRPLMENSRRLRELTTELATLALQQVRDDPTPDWPIRARSNLPSLFLRGPLLPFGGLGDGPHLGYDVLAERRALAGVERSDWACELTHHRVAVVAKPPGRVRRATSPAVPLGHRVVEPVELGGVGAVGGLRCTPTSRSTTSHPSIRRVVFSAAQHVADPVRDVLLPTPAAVRPGQGPTRSGVRSVPARPVLPGLSRSRPRAHRPVPPERRPAGERAPHARLPRG